MSVPAAKHASSLEARAVNAIRALTIDAVVEAGSGHLGMPLGTAPMGYVLFRKAMKFNPKNPAWLDRDRYVQSAGHGSMLQYSLLYLNGFELSMDDLKDYRQWGSLTPGHPENIVTPGVETTTGPLGQGISTAVGMALAEAHLAAVYNRPGLEIIDHRTYVIASDGDMMEGVQSEAASLAGALGLGKLIVLYDDNHVTIDGMTDITFTEDVEARYRAYGWHTQRVEDGNDLAALERAVEAAQQEPGRPSLIAVRTTIGYGSPVAGTPAAHPANIDPERAQETKDALGIDWPAFSVPEDVLAHYRQAVDAGAEAEARWNELYGRYQEAHPELAAKLEGVLAGRLPDELQELLPAYEAGKSIATRNASHAAINAVAAAVPQLMGGSADLAESNKTTMEGVPFVQHDDYAGRNIHFGVREHAMAAVANGLSLHGGIRPYVATFLIFSDYLRPSLRLAALMEQPVIYVFTHDSIALGGDGPTHQPIGQLMALRVVPNLAVLRPADANETMQAWALALQHQSGPLALALTRQGVPVLEVPAGSVAKGAYVLAGTEGTPELILIGTGSEVHLCLEAREKLEADGVRTRVVSMPSWELFEAQDESYRESVLPASVRARVSVEAGATLGWQKYVGPQGAIIGLDRFGASADGDVVMDKLGFNVENVVQTAKCVLGRSD
ncbi:MAG TPA: transketolase [Trueperaceae bacterium]